MPRAHCGRTAVSATTVGAIGVSTVNGDGQAQAALVSQLRVGRATLWDQPAMVLAGYGTAENRVDGLLPLSRFSTVTFNGRENYLVAKQ